MLDIALRYKEMEIKIIYEDADILVCEKPAGFPVQSRRIGQKDCVSVLKTYLYKKEERKGEPYPVSYTHLDVYKRQVLLPHPGV